MRNVLKWIGILLGGLLVLAFIAIVAIYFMTESSINKEYDAPVTSISIPDQEHLQTQDHRHLKTS